MPVLTPSGIGDLVTTTLAELGRAKFTDNMSDYQKTIALKRVFKKGKATFDSGSSVSFNVIINHNNSARFVGLAAEDQVNAPDVMITGSVPWRNITWNWMMEFREPLDEQRQRPHRGTDQDPPRRRDGLGRHQVRAVALAGPGHHRHVTSPYGIPYWVVKSNTATTTNNGFNGNVPSGYTTVGGINPTTYPRWKNYATQYTNVTKDDLVRKWRRAATYCLFMPLVDDIPVYNTGDENQYLTNYAVLGVLEELLEAQNDDLGNDVASMDGKVIFRRIPVEWVPELDLDTTNPVYGINWGEFKVMGLRGAWMKETVQEEYPGQHTVTATHTDCTFNYFCRNRRRNFVLATDTTLPSYVL
jgi:hypothetical protein